MPDNILIVDDTPANLNVLLRVLANENYVVRPAINGEVALNAIEEELPDLILLDIMMPHMNGYDVCKILKERSETAHIPVIFISSLDNTDDIVRAFEVGGIDYITKPFKHREILARVESQLTLQRQRRELEERHRRDMEHYEALNKMRDRFVHSATHDLKNPLNVIVGYANLMENMSYDEFQEKGSLYVQRIMSGANKMQYLVMDMLELAKFSTGTYHQLGTVSVNHFLLDCVQDYEVTARQNNLELRFSPLPQDIEIVLDQARMARALDNLVSNAIKYTPDGGKIEVSASQNGKDLIIAVRDSGLGIPEADLPHLFEAFYRVKEKEHREIEGTGLGLSIVKTIVEQHHGEVRVESKIGEGSTFYVRLPLQ